MSNKNNCIICGEEIVYFQDSRTMICAMCGREFRANASCSAGHYVCDGCHGAEAGHIIVMACGITESRNPIEIMRRIMSHPKVHMHGPEHHVLVGAALLAAYKNSGAEIDIRSALKEMLERGSQVPGGTCGLWGCCGAAVSSGIALSIITGATPMKKEEWGIANTMTSRALAAIAKNGGPRCCKRDGFTAAREAVKVIREYLGVELELPERIVCEFSHLNRECLGAACPFNSNNA